MTSQHPLTIIAKIKPEKLSRLRELFEFIVKKDVETNPKVPFIKITSIHFARFVILEEAKDLKGNVIKPSLAFSTNYDGDLDTHLRELVEVAEEGLGEIYECCEGYKTGDDFIS